METVLFGAVLALSSVLAVSLVPKMKQVLFVALGLALSSCANATVSAFQITGQINHETVKDFRKAPESIEYVYITSHGGFNEAAIELAREIRRRDVTLVVERYCLSACAQFLMPASGRVILNDKPLVGFHHTASAYRDLLVRSGELEQAEEVRGKSEREQQFYADIGTNPILLYAPYEATVPTCFWPSNDVRDGRAFSATWHFAIVPLDEFLKATKTRVAGSWPETLQEINQAAIKHDLKDLNISIRPADPVPVLSDKYKDRRITRCETKRPQI